MNNTINESILNVNAIIEDAFAKVKSLHNYVADDIAKVVQADLQELQALTKKECKICFFGVSVQEELFKSRWSHCIFVQNTEPFAHSCTQLRNIYIGMENAAEIDKAALKLITTISNAEKSLEKLIYTDDRRTTIEITVSDIELKKYSF